MATKYLGAQPTGGLYIWKDNKVSPYPWKDMGTAILVGVPGAYTPTCTDDHLGGFVEAIKEGMFDDLNIVFFSTNDVMVMDEWNKAHGHSKIISASDDMFGNEGNPADPVCKALGETVDFGETFGLRVQRCAFLVEDGEVTHKFIDPFVNGLKLELEELNSSSL